MTYISCQIVSLFMIIITSSPYYYVFLGRNCFLFSLRRPPTLTHLFFYPFFFSLFISLPFFLRTSPLIFPILPDSLLSPLSLSPPHPFILFVPLPSLFLTLKLKLPRHCTSQANQSLLYSTRDYLIITDKIFVLCQFIIFYCHDHLVIRDKIFALSAKSIFFYHQAGILFQKIGRLYLVMILFCW